MRWSLGWPPRWPGCDNLGYYAQAVGGHVAVMRAAQPISGVLGNPAGDPALKNKLERM
ncbi:MAG: aminopeptidase [Sulfuritalea sp.]|nr:aminopeptidase [Sulfuritalea sp.]